MATTSNGYNWNTDEVLKQIINERGKTRVVFVNGILTSTIFTELQLAIKLAEDIETTVDRLQNITPVENEKLSQFLKNYGKLDTIEERLNTELKKYSYTGQDFPNDLLEAFSQFWSEKPAPVSNFLNKTWIPGTQNFLNTKPENSLILISHSQGNFFIEDALPQFDANRLKVISLASPTDYSASGINPKNIVLLPQIGGEDKDPVPHLRYPVGLEPVKKIEHFLGSLKKIMSDVAEGLGIFHAISFPEIGNPLAEVGIEKFQDWLKDKGLYTGDIKGIPKGYLEKSRDNGDFKSFFNALNPRGYYFPNKPIIAQLSPKVLGKVLPAIGSADGDWIEGYKGDFLNMYGDNLYGNKGNDVLRGYQGNDELTGGQGWDFLDGGDGNDTATYNDSPKNIGIIVHTERKVYDGPNVSTYSDIYRVEDGYGQEDILVDIEEIVGSDSNDKMYGGEGIDIFEAEKGDDYFQGNGGNDKFYGDDGNDTAYGGIGDDELRGEGGDDTLYGGDGNDKISGGFR